MPDREHAAGRRMLACVERWPDAEDGDYNPRCCRFPKSCSPYPYPEALEAGTVTDADLEPAAVRTETTPDEKVWKHPLHRVIEETVRRHTTVRTPTGPITACACGELKLGQSWSQHIADLVLPALLDNLPTIDGRWGITPMLEHLDDDPPILTTTPPDPVLHNGDRISVADADGKGVSGYVAGWTTAPGGHPFVLLCTIDRPTGGDL